jgi:hypothetical protein
MLWGYHYAVVLHYDGGIVARKGNLGLLRAMSALGGIV